MSRRKKKLKKQRPFRSLRVWTAGVEGDTCPKRGGRPLRLDDGQCTGKDGKKRCRRYLGLGHFVMVKCAYR